MLFSLGFSAKTLILLVRLIVFLLKKKKKNPDSPSFGFY